jgi:molybdenum cofactor biosynthesis enzyme MoaA
VTSSIAVVARYKPIHPTVLIFHCTFVCDARCEMCSNWQRGDRKTDMTLEQIDTVFSSGLWKHIETANLSGGEPTTRNDMVEISKVMLDRLPRLRKFGINTTGSRRTARSRCHRRRRDVPRAGVIFSTRVSIDGIGDMHTTCGR